MVTGGWVVKASGERSQQALPVDGVCVGVPGMTPRLGVKITSSVLFECLQ